MLLACGATGLMVHQGGWCALPCPLRCPEMLACREGQLAVLDNAARTVWTGRHSIPVDSGVESMLLWGDCLLTLSGDTDCLTQFSLSSGQIMLTIPAGVYPQDMCLLPGGRSLAMCGGADGLLHIIRLPDLQETGCIRLSGIVQRTACTGSALYALCAAENDGLCCMLWRIHQGKANVLARWPGLPGALHADALGRLWIAVSEQLLCWHHGRMLRAEGEWGLIRHMDSRRGMLLASDPVLGRCAMVSPGRVCVVHEGDVRHAVFRRGI